MTDQSLPSSFDLWFDLKDRPSLVKHYACLKSEIEQIESMMASYGMEFTEDELAEMSPPSDVEEPTAPKPL